MVIAAFVIMALITLAGIAYPLWRPQKSPDAIFTLGPVVETGRYDALCKNCGRTLEGDELFCPGCGTRIGNE